jgi:hypothetical protein
LSLDGVSFPEANRGIGYDYSFRPSGGSGPFSFSTIAGTFPPGLRVERYGGSDGRIAGIPTQAGTFQFTLQISDAETGPLHQTATTQMIMTIDAKLVITTLYLPSGVVNRPYAGTFTAVNGTLPLHWTVDSIPQGVALDSTTGVFSGTPTESFTGITATVSDSSNPPQSYTAGVGWVIYGPLQFTQSDLGSIQIGYFGGLFAIPFTGGWPPVTSTLISGTLPPGMSLVGHFLSGLASQVGHYSIVVQLQDSASPPQTAQANLTFAITPLLPSLANRTLPSGIVGRPYDWGVAARNGLPPFTWSIRSGSLPPGLTLDSTGLIHGTPTAAGTYDFALLVSDSFDPPDTSPSYVTITINAQSLGRNDSIATATPLTNGSFSATISPYSDPSTSEADGDYYRLTANPGSTVSAHVFAERLSPPSPLDPVIEILNSAGTRFATCQDPASAYLSPPLVIDPNPFDYNNPCINDDDLATGTDSSLSFQVPGAAGGAAVTFYLHVLDFRGDARPDMQYQLEIQGAN